MPSIDILTAVLVFVLLIVVLAFLGKFFEKLSPETLKYIDYGSFALAAITGLLIYFGQANPVIRYIFFASIIVYFITLRHTMYKQPSSQD